MMEQYLNSFGMLSKDEIHQISTLAKAKKIKKGDLFIKEGRICNEVGFIVSGLFRSFYYSSSIEEVTYCFTFPTTFLTAYSSFISQTPTVENIEALTDAELLIIPRSEILKLEESSINWLRFFKLVAEQEYIKMEQRIFLLQREKAEQRYSDLLTNKPEFLQQIPLNYLASYLGITQRHLSRIRNSVSN